MEIIKMYETEIASANILRVAAGTNGFHGGDAGHGSKTFIEIEDLGGTEIEWNINKKQLGRGCLKINLAGDTELQSIIEAFGFIARTLRRQKGE